MADETEQDPTESLSTESPSTEGSTDVGIEPESPTVASSPPKMRTVSVVDYGSDTGPWRYRVSRGRAEVFTYADQQDALDKVQELLQ